MKHNFLNLTTVALLLACVLTVGSISVFADTNAVPQRSDIDDNDKWNLEDIYPTTDAWDNDFARIEESLGSFDKYQGHLGDSPDMLLDCLQLSDSLDIIMGKLYVYANLKLDEDQRVSESQETSGRIGALNSRLGQAQSFIGPEILSIEGDKLHTWLNEKPELDTYRFYLEDIIRSKEHILSEKEEAILSAAGQVTRSASNIFGMTSNADVKWGTVTDEDGNEVELTRGRYGVMLESPNRRLRREASEVYLDAWKKYENTMAATLEASIKNDWFYTKTRKYNTCLERSLDGNNIPTSVFFELIEAVNSNLAPLHKWTGLRKRILGVDTLYPYDLSAPLLDRESKKFTYEEAKATILEGLKPMGKEYLNNLETGFNSGWIDVYETEGKESGAYNWGSYATHPYVLMNFNGTRSHIFTLAHEMGHAMHSFYTNRTEPSVYSGHSLFTAEVASTANEAILMKYLLEKADNREDKIELLIQYIEQIIGTFYTQVMFSEFELAVHDRIERGEALSAEFMRGVYRDIYEKYWGPELVIPEDGDMGCLRIGHFYRQYYVYQYATCYAAAQNLSQRILDGEPGVHEKYIKFLSTGTSKYPVDILKDAGVDMTTPEPVNSVIDILAELVDEVERLLDEG